MTPIKLCIAGADGRMGSILLKEAAIRDNIQIVGALTADDSPNIGKKLKDIALTPSNLLLQGPSNLIEAATNADIFVSFTVPAADMINIPKVVTLKKKLIIGTTGFSEEQIKELKDLIRSRVAAVIAPNFSIGVNVLYKILEVSKSFPQGYDFSVFEVHHTGKADAPSGTAEKIGNILKEYRGYAKTIYGRQGISKRDKKELEILSARIGGVPGIHEILIAGQHEILKIEHTAFSRSVFAGGVLLAAEWLATQNKPGTYSMNDVLFGKEDVE